MLQNKLIVKRLNKLIELTHTGCEFNCNSQSLEESIEYLGLCIKYLIFDIEACRRENEALKQMLNEDNDLFC